MRSERQCVSARGQMQKLPSWGSFTALPECSPADGIGAAANQDFGTSGRQLAD
jgi:hypothetical protein